MKSIKRVRMAQPAHKKKVVELEIGGRVGRWFHEHNWGAFTLPLPFFVLILYWSGDAAPSGTEVDGRIRFHEFVHVEQDERNPFFLVSWVNYLWEMGKVFYWHGVRNIGEALMDAYRANKYEVEAYERTAKAIDDGLPPWTSSLTN